MPDHLFPDGSPHPPTIIEVATPRMQATNMSRISARKQPPASTMLYKTKTFKKWPTLELGDVILHTRPGSNERFECTVVDSGTSKAKGDWFLVSYAGNPGVEVKLSDSEMGEILAQRITVT